MLQSCHTTFQSEECVMMNTIITIYFFIHTEYHHKVLKNKQKTDTLFQRNKEKSLIKFGIIMTWIINILFFFLKGTFTDNVKIIHYI